MKRLFLTFLILNSLFLTPLVASADVSGLVPCKDSAVFKKRKKKKQRKGNIRKSALN